MAELNRSQGEIYIRGGRENRLGRCRSVLLCQPEARSGGGASLTRVGWPAR